MTFAGEINDPVAERGIGKDLLHEIVRRRVESARLDRIILFGSAARGRMGKDSGLDLLVVKSGVSHRRKLAQQIRLRMFGVAVPMDIVVVAPEDIEAFQDRVGTIIGSAVQEGKVIYAPRRCVYGCSGNGRTHFPLGGNVDFSFL